MKHHSFQCACSYSAFPKNIHLLHVPKHMIYSYYNLTVEIVVIHQYYNIASYGISLGAHQWIEKKEGSGKQHSGQNSECTNVRTSVWTSRTCAGHDSVRL